MPDILPGNEEAHELISACSTQVRFAGMGGFVGYDYAAIRAMAADMGIDTAPALWRKVRAVEAVHRKNASKTASNKA